MRRGMAAAMLAAAMLAAVPAAAKVNLSGALWTTYWAQQEGADQPAQLATGGTWVDAAMPAALYRGTVPQAHKKTFFVGQSALGNGVQAQTLTGGGLQLRADCPVADDLKAVGVFNVRSTGAAAFAVNDVYVQYALAGQSLQAGRIKVPFGREQAVRPTVGREEVFISAYAQPARGALHNLYDIGLQLSGPLPGGQLSYRLFAGNGGISTVADSNAMARNSQASPDINDGKQLGGVLTWKPLAGVSIEGAYFAGDYTNTNAGAGGNRARFSAYDINAGYDVASLLLLSAEYATTRHDRMLLESDAGAVGVPTVRGLTAARVNEYVLKAVWHGSPDWQAGVRYSVIDPKDFAAEVAAQYSRERKLSLAVSCAFAGGARLKAEYSRVLTDLDYYAGYDAAALAGQYRLHPETDPDDDIIALQLALQF